MARDATAIYIDDSAIRMLDVSGRRARQWAVEPLKAGLVRDGFVVDEAAVATAIRTLWAKEQPGSQRVIAGISGINCLYRLLTLPELPRNLLPEAVKREASRAFGVPLEQLHISWQTLPGKPNETLVYVAAAPRNTVDGLIRTLKQANLNPYMMDIAPLALARSTAEPSALIADLQPAGLDIVLKMAGMPEVIRSVSVTPGASLTERVAVVRQELQRAVTFYNSSHPDTPVGDDIPLLVAGELGEHQEAWPELLGRAGRRIEALQPPLESPAGFIPYLYAPTIGLVLKETAGKALEGYSRVSVNMLPEIYIPKPRPLSELSVPARSAGRGTGCRCTRLHPLQCQRTYRGVEGTGGREQPIGDHAGRRHRRTEAGTGSASLHAANRGEAKEVARGPAGQPTARVCHEQ